MCGEMLGSQHRHGRCQSGSGSSFTERLWASATRAPPLYPDAVTLAPSVTSQEVLQAIDASTGASVKDSFSTLDLAPHGFAVLFHAQWLAWGPASRVAVPPLAWRTVNTAADLSGWVRLHGDKPPFPPALLADPRVTILRTCGEGAVGAAVLFAEDGAVGVTNFFASGASDLVWSSLLAECRRRYPGHAVCGYETGAAAEAAIAAGATPCGPLRVWVYDGRGPR